MTDECIFSLDNTMSLCHTRNWSKTKPVAKQQKFMQAARQMVWCGMTSQNISGPYFFNGTVTAETYQEMINDFLLPELRRLRIRRQIIFQQDGAPVHTAGSTLKTLRGHFGSKLVSQKCDILWPARSPDLTPPDFFLWGTLKYSLKKKKPTTIDSLKTLLR